MNADPKGQPTIVLANLLKSQFPVGTTMNLSCLVTPIAPTIDAAFPAQRLSIRGKEWVGRHPPLPPPLAIACSSQRTGREDRAIISQLHFHRAASAHMRTTLQVLNLLPQHLNEESLTDLYRAEVGGEIWDGLTVHYTPPTEAG